MSYLKHIEYNEGWNVARGLVRGTSVIHKFGRNNSISAAPETIWMHGGIYSYLTSPSTLFTHSTGDDGAGEVGARTITIEGLDVNFNPITETVTVNSDVATTAQFLRVFRAFVATAGSLTTNDGNILISTQVNGAGTVVADISVMGTGITFGLGQTQLALYTIPAGYTGLLTNWNVGVGDYNDAITAFLLARELDGEAPFRSRDVMDVSGGFHQRIYNVPYRFPSKTDIEIRAINSSGTAVSSSFDIVLIENEFVESRSSY